MERQLNRPLLEQTLAAKGFTQTSVADALGLTKAAVSKWLTGKSFPRPPELLKLGKLLGLGYTDLVASDRASTNEPLIAFRKRASTKTTAEHVAHAKQMGRLLEPVVTHLGFDAFISPGRLKKPSLDYNYLQALAAEIRRDLKLDPTGPVDFNDLIDKFKEMQAVIIPVLWGQKTRHENALHIYLPASKTTWIYLNLDSRIHDFKFWMAHELGHVLAVNLLESGDTELAEDFSDAFAGALLFPEPAAKEVYEAYQQRHTAPGRIAVIMTAAERFVISPLSVYKEVQHFAETRTSRPFETVPEKAFYSALAGFNKGYPSVSEILFDGEKPSADRFMRISAEAFKTPFFAALGSYLKENPQSGSLVGQIFDVPLPDAKELRQALV